MASAAMLALAQDAVKLLPNSYRVVFENPTVRVVHVTYGPHEKLPLHEHPDTPTIYVYLSDSGPVRFSHVEEHAFTLVRPPETADTYRVSPGRRERHEVENLSDTPSVFLRVELKQIPLGFQPNSFRSPKDFEHTRSGISTEFVSPYFTIQRIIATGSDPMRVEPSSTPALLIALSPASVAPDKSLQSGDVLWMSTRAPMTIHTSGRSFANLLRITFLRPV